jgi:hypothetical protein
LAIQSNLSESEDGLERRLNRTENLANAFDMRTSTMKTKTTTFQENPHVRCKIAIENKTVEQVSRFNYLGLPERRFKH